MSTIFKTRISQQEVQTPVVSADTVVTDNFITSSIQSESVSSEEVLADLVSAVTIESNEVFATDTNTTNLVVTNDFSPGGDVIVSSGNVLVSKGGTVSFLDDGEIVEEDGATGFPVFSGIPEILNNGTIYNIGLIDKDTELSGIHFGGSDDIVQTCEIWFATGSDVYNIIWPSDFVWLDSMDGNAPAIVVNTEYRVALRKEKGGATVASIAYALGEGRMIIGESEPYELTAEAIKEVVPIAWSGEETGATANNTCSVALGTDAKSGYMSVSVGSLARTEVAANIAIGYNARVMKTYSTAIGPSSYANSDFSSVIGWATSTSKPNSIAYGTQFVEEINGERVIRTCTTEGTGSITIGAGANTLNTKTTVDGVETTVESSNSVTIGCKASNTGADSVVIGASASGNTEANVILGALASCKNKLSTIAGKYAYGGGIYATSFGAGARSQAYAVAIGGTAQALGRSSVAIGANAKVSDLGATVIRSTAEDGTYTQLYFSGANTPLANTYEDGEAMMGYVVRDSAGNIMTDAEGNAMVGTQKLSVLFPNNRGENAFTPAMLGLDDEWTPKPMFRPSDLDMPQEEPTEPETEGYTPLPVYPIVEPEIEEI